ncbi:MULTISPECIES: HAD family hydrolase [unclassified Streptomyces]|uniref:HAD family hydrolase n=1 Tax=unclassified Streptomyces TaxID=2593676 RepID=UPI0004BDF885|nr:MULTISPECIES: HAD family hydrolase [unclassified Streptomyces]
MIQTVVLDIGETLTRDDRYWAAWADRLGVPRHTLSALVGAVVVDGRDNADAIRLLRPGIDIAAEYAARDAAGRGERLDESDLYEDVRPALTALRAAGVRVIVAGNQSPRAGDLLRALDLPADLVVTSGEWRVSKPARAFFEQVLAVSGSPADETLYVGDHPANDIHPARAAGLRTAHIRRGPWGHWWADTPEVRAAADWSIDSLTELHDIVRQ